MEKILREPLLHFFIIGAAIFAVYYGVNQGNKLSDRTSFDILVTKGMVESLGDNFTRVWSRNPTEKELQGVIQDYIQEEVLYREALALGLDKNDTVIRRRLRQKMEFLSDEILQQYEPAEEELKTYFEQNKKLFEQEAQFSFTQVYLNPEKHKKTLDQEVAKLLRRLESKEDGADVNQLGDTILLEPTYDKSSYGVITGLFGKTFADEMLKLPPGKWEGPIHTGYGVHVVFLRERIDSGTPEFKEVRGDVRNHWLTVHRKEAEIATFREMTKRYNVVVEE